MSGARVRIDSEIGRLRDVVIHTPGPEIESMTPRTASEVLYNDIIPISVVSDEHRLLKRVLASVARVHETTDLLAASLADESAKRGLVDAVCTRGPALARRDELLSLGPEALVATLVAGLRARRDTLTEVLVGREYDLPPLPNLYFMRDSSFVVRDRVVVGAMAHDVRSNEAAIMRAIFSSPSGPASEGLLYDGVEEQTQASAGGASAARRLDDRCAARRIHGAAADPRLEGGDVLVVRSDLLLVGVSQRSSSESLDALASRLLGSSGEPLTVLAVVLPDERSTIHLDMIFTLVDRDAALVYEPWVTGPRSVDVYSLRLEPGSATKVTKCDGLLSALAAEGVVLEAIPCGGDDPVVREREQWLSAANVFAFAPGRIIGYDCNVATMDAFDRAGFSVQSAEEFLNSGDPDAEARVFVGISGINLARGGGGPRCMTLPIARDALA